tara:strand:+ start:1228 stop:1422 length:195 start_codon:yes stop_codon:yes gene_type:complete
MNKETETYSYAIIKQISNARHLLTYGDEIFETETLSEAQKIIIMLNENTDSDCTYELVSIPKRN